MNENRLVHDLIAGWFILAGATLLGLSFVAAPYGRHVRQGWGPMISSKLAWVIMEAPAVVVFAACFFLGEERRTLPLLIFVGLWEVHYVHRTFIYPLQLRGGNTGMPVVVAGTGFVFNTVNAILNGRYLFTLSGGYAPDWLLDPRFVAGLGIFLLGFGINRHADRTLRKLRRPGDMAYYIPSGGLYRWISCPNYLGEIIEWTGWAITTWSLPGLAFAAWTMANLAPRARAHHRWYRQRFSDYPQGRKALVPGVW